MNSLKTICLIIPVFNEEDTLPVLLQKIKLLKRDIPRIDQVIFVDDGSRDRSYDILHEEIQFNSHYRLVRFSRNFGHQQACMAGLRACRSDAAVIMDSDLQDPPEVIHEMIQEWDDGWDVVYGVRKKRKGESWFKLVTAKIFYRLLLLISEIPIPLDAGDFRLIDSKIIKILSRLDEQRPFLRGLVSWAGFRQKPIYYYREERIAGKTKYTLTKMVGLALDAMTSFSKAPFHWVMFFGGILFLVFIGGITAVPILWIFGKSISGAYVIFMIMLFFSSIQFLSLGIIGEYISRGLIESKKRPQFIIESDSGAYGANDFK